MSGRVVSGSVGELSMDTRERILAVAREVFAELGEESTTMRLIAERVDCTPTAIYHHFRDKEYLLREVCRLDYSRLAIELAQVSAVPDPVSRVKLLCMKFCEFNLNSPSHYRFTFASFSSHFENCSMALSSELPHMAFHSLLCEAVQEGLKRGLFRSELQDETQLTSIFWAMTHGIIGSNLGNRQVARGCSTLQLALNLMLRGTRREGIA